MIDRLCVIGVGLIGGSVARAARTLGLCREIVGIDRDMENLEKAKNLGVIDIAASAMDEGIHGADFIVIATPVGVIGPILSRLKSNWSFSAVYTDVGSTKHNVKRALEDTFGTIPANFIPGHPIAGSETGGVESSIADLFGGKRIILTPCGDFDPMCFDRVKTFWQDLGGIVSTMDVHHHDLVLAATSHLPHVVAYALTDMLGRKDEKDEILKYAAGGFKDFTRIASSDPAMWLDICLANRNKIIDLIDQMVAELNGIRGLLEKDSTEELREIFFRAKNARQRYLDQLER